MLLLMKEHNKKKRVLVGLLSHLIGLAGVLVAHSSHQLPPDVLRGLHT